MLYLHDDGPDDLCQYRHPAPPLDDPGPCGDSAIATSFAIAMVASAVLLLALAAYTLWP
jgi:hypothetical protein